jgi:hypothetical protein
MAFRHGIAFRYGITYKVWPGTIQTASPWATPRLYRASAYLGLWARARSYIAMPSDTFPPNLTRVPSSVRAMARFPCAMYVNAYVVCLCVYVCVCVRECYGGWVYTYGRWSGVQLLAVKCVDSIGNDYHRKYMHANQEEWVRAFWNCYLVISTSII